MKTLIRTCSLALALAIPGLALGDSITPGSYSATLSVGESTTIRKVVTVDSAGSPKVDVFFLADTTGSMGPSLTAVKNSAASILSAAAGLGDIAFGVGEYKDRLDAYAYRLNTDITTNLSAAQSGLGRWSAGGGNDYPEANLFALKQVADTTSWRPGSERILVWFGDAPGHDPSLGVTEAQATAALVNKGIQVEAINVGTLSNINLDTCTLVPRCRASSEGGPSRSGQASRITAATGGSLRNSTNSAAIVAVIKNAINNAISQYTEVALDTSATPAGLDVSVAPGNYLGAWDRSMTRSFAFDVTFTALGEGSYDFPIYATVDGGRVATELDHITVRGRVGAVPEPGMLALMGMGLLLLGQARKKHKA